MLTIGEADSQAAAFILSAIAAQHQSDLPAEVVNRVRLIEQQLRRRVVGGDKILTRQMERPTGRQVGMSPKKAREYGIPEK